MSSRTLAAAVAVVFALSMPRGVAAKGHGGGGHSGGGHAGGHGGHSSGARSGGGQARSGGGARTSGGGGTTSGGSARGGASQPAPAPARAVHGGGRTSAGGATAAGVSQPRGSRSPNGHLVVGTAAPRVAHAQTVVPFAPVVFLPQIFRPHFVGFGFGYGVRRLGVGYGAGFYGLAYDHPLLCGDMIDCYAAPVPGALDVAPTYDAAAPPSPDEAATIVLQVQPTSAQVFVDGEFVGTVDDLQSAVTVAPGVHRVEFRAPGFDPIVVDIRVAPGGRITYRATLKPSA